MRQPKQRRFSANKKRARSAPVVIIFAALMLGLAALAAWRLGLISRSYFSASHFGIETLRSGRDENQNGTDDYTDILQGAREDAKNHPRYDGAYWQGGYPPDDIGVCTDVVWRALRHAGYDLKSLVDADIKANPTQYPGLDATGPDPNIDFRRVRNLVVFFSRHSQVLTNDLTLIAEWQPGDIVVFGSQAGHIGIVSDRRNKNGTPWLIHNSGQPLREEDALERLASSKTITGHFRWVPAQPGTNGYVQS